MNKSNVIIIYSYILATPVPCHSPSGYTCLCNFKQETRTNIYSCSSTTSNKLPLFIHKDTNTIVVKNRVLFKLCGSYEYLDTTSHLDLQQNGISSVCNSFVLALNESKTMQSINLANNELQTIPKSMKSMKTIRKLKLGGNPFQCNCDMTWMIGWLNINRTQQVVDDYTNVICHDNKFKGKPVYLLNLVDMGCFPSRWTNSQKIGVGIGTGVILLVTVFLAVMVLKKSREIKFFLYYYCKWCICFGVPRDDKNEKSDKVEYDAYLSYRYFNYMLL